jgi:hypothetical protein
MDELCALSMAYGANDRVWGLILKVEGASQFVKSYSDY